MKAIYVNNLSELGGYLQHFKINKKKPVRRRGVKLQLVRPAVPASNTQNKYDSTQSGYFSKFIADLKWLFKR